MLLSPTFLHFGKGQNGVSGGTVRSHVACTAVMLPPEIRHGVVTLGCLLGGQWFPLRMLLKSISGQVLALWARYWPRFLPFILGCVCGHR